MGFFDQGTATKTVTVTVLLPGFEVRAELQVIGMLQAFLNDEQRGGFTLLNASVYGLEAGNPATSMQVDELHVRKDQCHLLAFEEQFTKEETGLLMRVERLVVYTPYYAVQGNFHLMGAAVLSEFMASSHRQFLAATGATIFPLFRPQSPMIQQAALAFMHRDVAHMHHAY